MLLPLHHPQLLVRQNHLRVRRFRSEWHSCGSRVRRLSANDGYSLLSLSTAASAVSPYGGDYLNSLLFDKLSSQKIQVTPHCFLKKQIVEGVVANIQRIDFPNTRASFLKYAIMVPFLACLNRRTLFAT